MMYFIIRTNLQLSGARVTASPRAKTKANARPSSEPLNGIHIAKGSAYTTRENKAWPVLNQCRTPWLGHHGCCAAFFSARASSCGRKCSASKSATTLQRHDVLARQWSCTRSVETKKGVSASGAYLRAHTTCAFFPAIAVRLPNFEMT